MEFPVKLLKHFLIVFGSILAISSSLIAQPALIPNDPGNNIYAITFTDPNQTIIAIEFDEDITNLGNTTGWTITVGGAPVAILGLFLNQPITI